MVSFASTPSLTHEVTLRCPKTPFTSELSPSFLPVPISSLLFLIDYRPPLPCLLRVVATGTFFLLSIQFFWLRLSLFTYRVFSLSSPPTSFFLSQIVWMPLIVVSGRCKWRRGVRWFRTVRGVRRWGWSVKPPGLKKVEENNACQRRLKARMLYYTGRMS